jgi:hypothetical protein
MDSEKQPSSQSRIVRWNKGRLTGRKRPLKPKDVWAIRVRLQLEHRKRDLALFNLAIDSKLRGCDLVRLQVNDVCAGGRVRDRATIIQKKTGRPVQFEITQLTQASIDAWLSSLTVRRTIPFPKPLSGAAAPLNPTVCSHRPRLGRERRTRQLRLRHSLDAADESSPNLQKDGEPASGSAVAWAHEARKHCSLPRHRGRRCAQHFGASRALISAQVRSCLWRGRYQFI